MSGVAVTIAVVIIILVIAVLLFGKLRTSMFFTVKTQEIGRASCRERV